MGIIKAEVNITAYYTICVEFEDDKKMDAKDTAIELAKEEMMTSDFDSDATVEFLKRSWVIRKWK